MKKLLLSLVLLCFTQLIVVAQSMGQNWNFSVAPWFDNPEFWSTTTIDGLTVHATESYPTFVTFDAQISAEAAYKQAMVFSAIPTQWDWMDTVPLNYAVSFEVSGPGSIAITALSAYQENSLIAIKGPGSYQEINIPQTYSDPYGWGTTVPINSTYYNGGPGRVYIYPASGSLKLYEIKAENVVVPIDTTENVTFNAVVPLGTHQCWVVGSFDDWNTGIGQMYMVDSTHFTLTLPIGDQAFEYKYLSGPYDWAFVEKGPFGEEVANRTWTPSDTVASWANLFVPDSEPVEKDVTLEVKVPLQVNNMYVTGSYADWTYTEANKMNLIETGDEWKKFSLTIHTNDARYLAYKFAAGPGWNYGQTEDMEYHYPNPELDSAFHTMFGFWQYEGYDKWVRDWYMDNYSQNIFTSDGDMEGIKIYAEPGYPVSIESTEKYYEQFSINQRLVLPLAKFTDPENHNSAESGGISIHVGDSCQISIICFSNASTTESAEILINDGENIIGVLNAASFYDNTLDYQVFNYYGGEKTLYFYTSSPAGVSILYLGTTHFIEEYHQDFLNYTVEVPAGTMQVYMAGDFNGWEPNHWMDRIDSTHFSTTLWGVNEMMQYKYCAGPSWDFRELNTDGSETNNRTWTEMDKVVAWANLYVPQYTRIYTEPVHTGYQQSFVVSVKSESNEPRQPISYQFTYWYDPWMMEYEGFDIVGTLSEGGEIIVNPVQWNGAIYVSYMSTEPMAVNGELIRFKFKSTSWGETWPGVGDFYYNADQIWDVYSTGPIYMHYYQEGDVDGNYMIQAYDAALTLQYSVGMDPMPMIDPLPWEDWRMNAADCDHAEGITANDASMILQYSAHLIYSFDEIDSTAWKVPFINDADVLVTKENNHLVFRSVGNLMGFNLYVNEHSEVLGMPVISDLVTMSAVNTDDSNYAIGIANIHALQDSAVFMTIPIVSSEVEMISLNMIVNTMGKDLKEALVTETASVNNNLIQIYPNPATDHLIISDIQEQAKVTIYDITGKLMYQETLRNQTERISVDGWNPGVYTVRVLSDDKNFTTKFMKK